MDKTAATDSSPRKAFPRLSSPVLHTALTHCAHSASLTRPRPPPHHSPAPAQPLHCLEACTLTDLSHQEPVTVHSLKNLQWQPTPAVKHCPARPWKSRSICFFRLFSSLVRKPQFTRPSPGCCRLFWSGSAHRRCLSLICLPCFYVTVSD